MAERTFTLRTEPHTARIGPHVLLFEPEILAAEFVSAYTKLQAAQTKAAASQVSRKATATQHARQPELPSGAVLTELEAAMRDFLDAVLLPESREVLAGVKLPQRVFLELIEWVAELYGGGSGNPDEPTGQSSD